MARITKSSGLQNPLQDTFPVPIKARRAPKATDTDFELGQLWINTLTKMVYVLAGSSGAGSTWSLSTPSAVGPITPYVVGPEASANFSTIQSALDAANTAGGGVVYIQSDNYAENLTLYDSVDLYGTPAVSQNQGQSVSITGTHTPPTSGHVGFNSICFISTTNAFLSAAAGTARLVFVNCESAIQSGYFLNLLNWTGTVEIFDYNSQAPGAPFAIDDGGFNNTGGASLVAFSAGIGSVGTNAMIVTGPLTVESSEINCELTCQTGTTLAIKWTNFGSTVTLNNNTTGQIFFCSLRPGATQALVMNSSASVQLDNCVIDTSNNPAIGGTGGGTLQLNSTTFTTNAAIAGTVTEGTGSSRSASLTLSASTENALPAFGIGGLVSELGPLTNGQLVIGSTGNAAVPATLASSGATISITNGPGTINLETGAGGPGDFSNVTIDPGASGDSWLQFDINSTGEFRIGVDDDDGDAFKISQGSSLGNNDTFVMNPTGERVLPLQSAFSAIPSAAQDNVTGDGTVYTILFPTEIFDQNSDFSSPTYTSPMTSRVFLKGAVQLTGGSSSFTEGSFTIVTSNRSYRVYHLRMADIWTAAEELNLGGSTFADMDTADTASVTVEISGSTQTLDVNVNPSPVDTAFQGYIVC